MKKNLYICIAMIVNIFTFTSCKEYSDINTDIKEHSNFFSVSEAKSYFEANYFSTETTRLDNEFNNNQRTLNILNPGDYTPHWDNVQASENNQLSSLIFSIDSEYKHKALASEFSNGKATSYCVNISQKLLFVKSKVTHKTTHYLLSLIPTKDFFLNNPEDISNNFLNSGDKGCFSGFALYTKNGYPVRLNKYINGNKVRGISLVGATNQIEIRDRLKIILNALNKFKFLTSRKLPMTRMGEDDEMDYGSSEYDWWYEGNDLFIDDCGNIFVDSSGDGEPDSVWVPDTEVVPEDSNSDPDPTPDPGWDEQDQGYNGDETHEEGEYADDPIYVNEGTSDEDKEDKEAYVKLGLEMINKAKYDIQNGNFGVKKLAFDEFGNATLQAFGIGLNTYGLPISCLDFLENCSKNAATFGKAFGAAGFVVGALQTIVVFTDDEIATNGDILSTISTGFAFAALIASGPVAGAMGVTACVFGVVSVFVTNAEPMFIQISLKNGRNAYMYIPGKNYIV